MTDIPARLPRVGIGFDLHRLIEGRPFVLGGVTIPFHKGPLGHSDGDALTHAIIDALLGAASMGDIGMWFPPGDPDYAGANSLQMLKKVMSALKEKNYCLVNLDAVVLCEKPKLSPHYDLMMRKIAEALEVPVEQVSVKATTNEGLGDIGKGDAVAAKAVALIY
jgi:2-C-methyl-D-erythritol 2,4-cyclodiphosphate synthase